MRLLVKRGATLLLIVGAFGCDGFVGEATVKAPTVTARTTPLDRARDVLALRAPGAAIGNIQLAGYNFHREMDLGGGLRMIAISCNLGGGLAVFRSDGSAVTTQPTKEITTVQLIDLDEDGVSEVLTEEIDGRGTGVLDKTFRVYRIVGNGVREVWSGESYIRRAPDEHHIEETIGFVRFDGSGAGRNARLTHLVIDPSHREKQTSFEWMNGRLAAIR